MKTADISDEAFVAAVREGMRLRGFSSANRWVVASILAGHPERVPDDVFGHDDQPPEKIVLSKARKLIRRGVLDGCYCGCRGDFSPIEIGDAESA